MVYTTGGCELARITIVNSKYQPILDEFVCPDNPVIDCNSRFSGLKLEDIEQAKYHITDIQAKLLNLFDSDTILIGHSLESDLIALKLIHKKIVDTSIVFPHRLGLPNKRALRNLVSEILQQIIQQDENGHNSMEDAVACMQLVHYKVKEDLRRGKWNFS
uniref:Exonuclease domain-containing protein n=1 Tax=Schistosoma japonicum TaxID=6182 RepID=Q5DDC5_SCHJA|nr:unknown [Schistosoma japonicum]